MKLKTKCVGLLFKYTLGVGLLNLAIITFSAISLALPVEQVPSPRQSGSWVTDTANTLSPETETELNRLISELEAQNGCEIIVVTVPETAPYSSPKEFTTTWFNYWHIGKQGKDNGVLFMYSQGDNRIEIETGYGVEDILPDAQVGNLIRTEIRPRFNQGDFDGGTLVGTQKLIKVLKTYQSHQRSNPTTIESPVSSFIPSPIIDKKYIAFFKFGGILLAIMSGGGMLVMSRRPVLISPQARDRIKGLDKHDKPIYYLACVCLFSATFAATLNLGVGLVAASVVGGLTVIIITINGRILYFLLSMNPRKFFDKERKIRSIRPLHCNKCQQPLTLLDSTSLLSHLSQPESVAQNIGSVLYEGWQCPNCHHQQDTQAINLRAYVLNSNKFSLCPTS